MSIGNMPPEPDFWFQTPIGGFGDTPPKTDYGSLVVPIIALGVVGIAAFLLWRWMRSPKVQREARRSSEAAFRMLERGAKSQGDVAAKTAPALMAVA